MSTHQPESSHSRLTNEEAIAEGDAKCPACGSSACVVGTLGGRPAVAFQPIGLRFWTMGPTLAPITRAPRLPGLSGIANGRGLRACADCGLVWTHVDPARLRTVIESAGKPELRAVLGPPLERPRVRARDRE
jgi:hypothetical protein